MLNNTENVAASYHQSKFKNVADYINSHLQNYQKFDLNNSTSSDNLETAQELTEDDLKATDWKTLYDMLEDVPPYQVEDGKELRELKDKVLVNLIRDGIEVDFHKYVDLINEEKLRIDTIIDNLQNWSEDICKEVITLEITKFGDNKTEQIVELEKWLKYIGFCEEMKEMLVVPSWSVTHEICKNDKEIVFLKLLKKNEVNMLVNFMKLYTLEEITLHKLTEKQFLKFFDSAVPHEKITEILDNLPLKYALDMCYILLKQMKKLQDMEYIVTYMLNKIQDEKLCRIRISLKMLYEFPPNEQEPFLYLLSEPVDIIEVLIMNSKFDKLKNVLMILKSECLHTEFNDEKLSVEHIDEVLRTYAEKSLDFRVITNPNPRLIRIPKVFLMPEEVPTKDEWVPNYEVIECMCCQKVTFSMFNRRHHCRRCGRVVCYNCSLHRMLVPSYGDLLVRVCLDCYYQSDGSSEDSDNVSAKSIIYDIWLLTDDPEHNKIVREEFSYEEAPSVSLCLSIMKHHSKNIEYPRFLLEQCNVMLQLLRPSHNPTKEIDYLLVIKMLKSIAVAAKMASQEGNLHYGTSLADNILSQADLLHLLAERGCLNLLPLQNNYAHNPYIDASIIRKLRDRLLEEEQWNLALEVSTKTGLDNTGVFAAWGKTCLRVGCLHLAREKFQRCLEKSGFYESFSDLSISPDYYSDLKASGHMSKSLTSVASITSETKPAKDPPLLKEIIHILESNSTHLHPDIIAQLEKRRASTSSVTSAVDHLSLLNKLKNLKNASDGKPQTKERIYYTQPTINKVFYEECIYYLSRYGTHLSLLKFFIRHGNMNRALNYMVENHLSSDVFIDIYTWCLKNEITEVVLAYMSAIDSTLDLWKDYLRHLCRHLEKQKSLHALYQLQQFMGDFIRAAMTCIRFYQENASNFIDLLDNEIQLHKAVEHLNNVLEQEQWVDVSPVRKSSSISQEDFEEKAIANPSLVMRMHPKDIDKHVSTIVKQQDIVKFLAECEELGKKPMQILPDIRPTQGVTLHSREPKIKVPTLFGSATEKAQLAVLAIVCGQTIEEGYNIAFKLIQDFNIKPVKIYCEAGKQLAKMERYDAIVQLVNCIKECGTSDQIITDACDEMLLSAVVTFTKVQVSGTKVEDLIKLISDLGTKISAYIEAKQLKTAYFLAVKYKRMSHIRRIMKEAELLNQTSIKTLCQKVLQNHSHTPVRSKNK